MSASRAQQKAGKGSKIVRAKEIWEDFWCSWSVDTWHFRLFEVAFFAILALDCWLQIAHAPRYGWLGFNVSHLSALDALVPLPTSGFMMALYTALSLLALRIVVGGGDGRVRHLRKVVLCGLFAVSYFVSQLNSYQHEYLIFLLLLVLVVFRSEGEGEEGEGEEGEKKNGEGDGKTPGPLRMIAVSLSLVYFYAAIAKLDGAWLDGSTLQLQIRDAEMRELFADIGWEWIAKLTLVSEFVLALSLQFRRSWLLALAIGPAMHIAFEWSGLAIGLFSYYMLAVYLLFLPKKAAHVLSWPLRKLAALWERLRKRVPEGRKGMGVAIVLTWLVGFSVLDVADAPDICLDVALVFALVELAVVIRLARPWASLFHVLPALVIVGLFAAKTEALRDHYRFMGGNYRRAGDLKSATVAYEKVVELAPDYASGHRNLADLYRRQDRYQEAIDRYQAGLRVREEDAKLHSGLAATYEKTGDLEAARRHALRAVYINKKDKQALGILRRIGAKGSAPTK